VQIAVGSEGLWRRFCEGFDLDADATGLATNAERVAGRDAVVAIVEAAFAGWRSAELLARLDEVGVPAGRVRTLDQVYDWDQTRSQGLVVEVEHSRLGPITIPGPPLRFFDPDGTEVTRTAHTAPPTLDEHGPRIRSWLGTPPQ